MQFRPAFSYISYIIFVTGIASTLAVSSSFPGIKSIRPHKLPRSALDQRQAPSGDIWPDFPSSVRINTTDKRSERLRFFHSGRDLTATQSNVLKALLSSIVKEYDGKSPSVEVQPSGYRAQDIQFLANTENPRLTIALYLNALMTVQNIVDKWGAKELDFEIRLDAGGITSRSNFHIRTGNSSDIKITHAIDLSVVIASSIPIGCQPPGKILSATGLTVRPSYPSENQSSELLHCITAVRTGLQIVRASIDAMSSNRANACSDCIHNRNSSSWRYPIKTFPTAWRDSSGAPNVYTHSASTSHLASKPYNRTITEFYRTRFSSSPLATGIIPAGSRHWSRLSITPYPFPDSSSQAFGRSHTTYGSSATELDFPQHSVYLVTVAEGIKSERPTVQLTIQSLFHTKSPILTSPPFSYNTSKLAADATTAFLPLELSKTDSVRLVGSGTGAPSSNRATNGSNGSNTQIPFPPILFPGFVVPELVLLPPLGPAKPPPDERGRPRLSFATSASTQPYRGQTSMTVLVSPTPTPATLSSVTTRSTLSSVSTSISACSACSICPTVRYEPNLGPVSGSASESVESSPNQRSASGALGRRLYFERRDFQEVPDTILGRGIGGPSCTVHPYIRRRNHPSPTDVSSWEGQPNMPQSMIAFLSTATWWAIPTELPNCGGPNVVFENTNNIEVPVVPGAKPYIIGRPRGRSQKGVTIDHVYEVKFLDEFFVSQINIAFNCEDIATLFNPVDYTEWPAHPAVPNSIDTRLNTIFGQLARYAFPDFVGMDSTLNQLKGNLWKRPEFDQSTGALVMRGLPIVFPNRGQDNLEALASITVVMILLNKPRIKQLFHNTNDRIYKAFAGIDEIINEAADPCNGLPPYRDHNSQPMKATWASAYKAWITNKIVIQNAYVASTAAIYSSQFATTPSPNVPVEDHSLVPGWSTWMSNWNQNYGLHVLTFPSISTWPAGYLNIQKRQALATSKSCNAITSSPLADATVSTIEPAASTKGFATVVSSPVRTSMGSPTVQPISNSHAFLSQPPRYSRPPAVPAPRVDPKAISTNNTNTRFITDTRESLSLPPTYSERSAYFRTPVDKVTPTTSAAASKILPEPSSHTLPSNNTAPTDSTSPAYQVKPLHPDNCRTMINLVAYPALYSIYCTARSPTHFILPNNSNVGARPRMASITIPRATWVWTEQEPQCGLGFYLPVEQAIIPSQEKCQALIMEAMANVVRQVCRHVNLQA